VFWVISVQFNIRNTLPKFCPFLLGHPVCYAYCFSTTTMDARTLYKVTLYAHCLSCLKEENASLIHPCFGFYIFIRLVLPFDDRKLIIAFCDVLNIATLFLNLIKLLRKISASTLKVLMTFLILCEKVYN